MAPIAILPHFGLVASGMGVSSQILRALGARIPFFADAEFVFSVVTEAVNTGHESAGIPMRSGGCIASDFKSKS
jgi:hypothetical protein